MSLERQDDIEFLARIKTMARSNSRVAYLTVYELIRLKRLRAPIDTLPLPLVDNCRPFHPTELLLAIDCAEQRIANKLIQYITQ